MGTIYAVILLLLCGLTFLVGYVIGSAPPKSEPSVRLTPGKVFTPATPPTLHVQSVFPRQLQPDMSHVRHIRSAPPKPAKLTCISINDGKQSVRITVTDTTPLPMGNIKAEFDPAIVYSDDVRNALYHIASSASTLLNTAKNA